MYLEKKFERVARWSLPAIAIMSFLLGIIDREHRLGYLIFIPAACLVMTSFGFVDAWRTVHSNGRMFIYGLSFLMSALLFVFLLIFWL
jgi:hypothetical protein